MADYVLPHTIPQEDERLTLMSRMLDPQMFFRFEQLGVAEGWRCLEVGAGNGSVSHWLAGKVGPTGRVIASDIDTRFLDRIALPNLEVRQIDVTLDPLGEGYDLVCGRAFLHHIPQRIDVLGRLAKAVKPGGFILIEEPDFHRCWRRTAPSCAISGRDSSPGPPITASTTSSAAGWRRCSRTSAWRSWPPTARRYSSTAARFPPDT